MIWRRTLSTCRTTERGTFGLIFPRCTPPLRRSKTVFPPVVKVPLNEAPYRGDDRDLDPDHGARQDVRPEVGLVDVDPDTPHALFPRGLERPNPHPPATLKMAPPPSRSDRERRPGTSRNSRALRVGVQGDDSRRGLPRAGLVADDPAVDTGVLPTSDRADHVPTGPTFLHEPRHVPRQVAGFLGTEHGALDVLRHPWDSFQECLDGYVGKEELRIGVLRRDSGNRPRIRGCP